MRTTSRPKLRESGSPVAGLSILIIDDDAGMLRALEKALSGEGADVASVECAEEAVDILTLSQKHFDLIITDLWMPHGGGTGMTVIRVARELFPSLPVIVLTAFGSLEVKAESLRQGVAAFLEKPLDASSLLGVIAEVCAAPRVNAATS